MHKRLVWSILLSMIVITLACNYPGYGEKEIAEETQIPLPSATSTIAPLVPTTTSTSEATGPTSEQPVEDDENTCTYKSAFLDDITYPDDSEIETGTVFTKTWRIHNSGTCPWESGTQLVFHSGEDIGTIKVIDVPATDPDGVRNVSVVMTAPSEAGAYRSNWQLQTPDGVKYGSIYFIKFNVPGETTPTPTVTPSGSNLHFGEFNGKVADDCSEVSFTWQDGPDESTYQLTGADADEPFTANTNSYIWENPITGTHVLTLQVLDADDNELDSMQTTIVVDCSAGDADMKITEVEFEPEEIAAFLPISMSVTIKNVGVKDAGSFKVQWLDGTLANTEACAWWATEGLPAGESVTFYCDDYFYTSGYVDIVTEVIVDATNIIKEDVEENNTYKQTIDVIPPITEHNLVVIGDQATWTIGPPTASISFGEQGAGSASWTTKALENGLFTPEQCLLTQPKAEVNGWVQGTYDALGSEGYIIQEGDVLYARAALLQDADGAQVTFKVLLRSLESGSHWIVDVSHTYGDGIETMWVDLSPYAGKEAVIVLIVEGGSDTADDLACWLDALVYRRP